MRLIYPLATTTTSIMSGKTGIHSMGMNSAWIAMSPLTLSSTGNHVSRFGRPSLFTAAAVGTTIGVGAVATSLLHLMHRQRRGFGASGACSRNRSDLPSSITSATKNNNNCHTGEQEQDEDENEHEDENNEDSQQHQCIYMDYNGTTPVKKEVVSAMLPFMTSYFGNPSSSHAYGTVPKRAIQKARREVAMLLLTPQEQNECCNAAVTRKDTDDSTSVIIAAAKKLDDIASSIVFTGCGTEADNMAIHLAIEAYHHGHNKESSDNLENENTNDKDTLLPHIVTTNVEHPAIVEYLRHLEQHQPCPKLTVTYVPVNEEGFVVASDVLDAIRPNTCLVTLMLANNESGALMPVANVARECRRRNVLCHTDAAQAVGKVPINLKHALGDVDMVTMVGHKFGAPKGVAALYIRSGCLLGNNNDSPQWFGASGGLLLGGGQEGGRRAGTENVPYIVGMGRAAALVAANLEQDAQWMERLRQKLLSELTDRLGASNIRVNGPLEESTSKHVNDSNSIRDMPLRLPNTLSVGIRDVQSGNLLRQVGQELAASAGAACHSSGGTSGGVSSVLMAMNVPMNFARGTLRLSVGTDTTEDEVRRAAKIIARETKRQWEDAKCTNTQ
jgi:cysteine desulfurase